ncbi:MAG TPA: LLM class F420-dependent oxidoreductase [Dehalococcoidia bacterium]|nr:LLM class F420-dependent oxidoreductase [Dehalococcoidia bacterium]HIK89289.1 LLM class F420-dependent oxidoreductase [Dehalococcoidia bacterium]
MDIGIVFPQMEISADRGGVKAFGQAAESLGFTHISSFDHVIGANLENRPDWKMMNYTLASEFQEPLVLFGFLSGVTESLGFSTSIMILPQRQTVLVAKQAATVDILCEGRFRLGIGTGWNEIEYESLNEDFKSRGKRSEEQIEVMRALWSNKPVDYKGEWHSIPDAGIAPLPIQQPIPVWLGGGATNVVLRRIARISDGWMPQWQPNDESLAELERVHGMARDFGRNPSDIGLDGRLPLRAENSDAWAEGSAAWEAAGATHMSIVTMNDGLKGADAHIRRLEEFRSAVPA